MMELSEFVAIFKMGITKAVAMTTDVIVRLPHRSEQPCEARQLPILLYYHRRRVIVQRHRKQGALNQRFSAVP